MAANYLVYPLFKLIWIKKIVGKENFPEGGFIIAANHQSYFDFIGLYGITKRKIIFLAAEKFFYSKFWRPIVEHTDQIKVDRKGGDNRQAIADGINILKNAGVLALFPQGTRSRTGEIEKTYTGVARLALAAKVPVVPIGIRNAFEIFPPNARIPKMRKKLEFYIGKPLFFTDKCGKEGDATVCRQVTNEIMLQIAELAGKKYKPE